MKPGAGRNKGSAFEREVAAVIIKTFAGLGIGKEDCYRTPSSGGHRFAKKTDPGDLVCSARLQKLWPFAVECKHYKEIRLDWLMVPNVKSGLVSNWWKQAVAAASVGYPLLVFRQDRQQAYAMYPETTPWSVFTMDQGVVPIPRPAIYTKVNGQRVVVVRLSSLLKAFKKRVSR